jgi:hypothetical protein
MRAVLDSGPLIAAWNRDHPLHPWAENFYRTQEIGSLGLLELAINAGSAEKKLGLKRGMRVDLLGA